MRLYLRISVLLLLFLALAMSAASQTVETDVAVEPYREVPFNALEPGADWTHYRWDRNHLLAWVGRPTPNRPAVALYDAEGRFVRDAIVWFPHATAVTLTDAAVTSSAGIVVSGGAGNEGGSAALFIAAIDASGHMEKIIRTNTFVPTRICTADDGTIWSYGWDKAGAPYDMLRQFDFSTGELNSTLRRTTFPRRGFLYYGSVPPDVALRCDHGKIVLYLAPTEEVIEYDPAAKKLTRWRWRGLPPGAQVTGFALTSDGEMFASFNDSQKGREIAGLFRFRPNTSAEAVWVPVKGMEYTRGKGLRRFDVLGNSGRDLVLRGTKSPASLNWGRIRRFSTPQ